ncbi:hypothetical protein [Flavobacterium sp. GT3R68]|uniref:hypothetical protein n=1 Tax=Flavobacterium sp. GT3R68 TaxID=2594437 RepID=UPI000F88EB93|nr:hypothetical protein [Flavobacterium sp. GT3R68]RTY91784.1 hypothetical protein EKL32_18135 [Flavobacterium sp. GSN2]TRW90124.1 hypothetical protein FNW07_11745 [Flavobacterium sp. GT3R68]
MKDLNKVFCLLLVFILFSCKKEEKEVRNDSEIRSRYYNLEKIGWKSRSYVQKVDEISFTATEVPIQYYLLKNKGSEDLIMVDSLYEENKKERVVEFIFQEENENELLKEEFTGISYEDGIKYMSFSLDKDFYVVTSKNDTIPCSGVTYERSYKIAPYQKVLLFFSGIQPEEKIQLIYNDRLFKKGTLKFKFKDTYTEIAL